MMTNNLDEIDVLHYASAFYIILQNRLPNVLQAKKIIMIR